MAKVQNTPPPGSVDASPQIRTLATRCVIEELPVAEITDVSEEVRQELRQFLAFLSEGTKDAQDAQDDNGQNIIETDPRLQHFADHYQRFSPKEKARCPWPAVRRRLLKNNAHFLLLAEKMNGGGVLFGIDEQGNPLNCRRR